MLENSIKEINEKNCIIEIWGLGYVGFPLAVRLASEHFLTYGVDKDPTKITRFKNHILVESEIILQEKFLESIKSGKIIFSNKVTDTKQTKISIICVPTPIPNQDISSYTYVKKAIDEILTKSKTGDMIIVESSIEVGTMDKISEWISDKKFKVGKDIGLAFCPERVDPLNKKWKLENIPRIIYCSDDQTFEIAKKVYFFVNHANLVRVSSAKVAEVVKSFENAFRLVNISLVNELAILCDKLEINVNDVIKSAATKPFGFMPFYTSAGVGGHCIPKDPKFLLESAKKFGINFDTLENALNVNAKLAPYISNIIEEKIREYNLKKSVIICGMAYKPDIEDFRDSPGFRIFKELTNKGFKVTTYDPFFNNDLKEKYLKENHMEGVELTTIDKLTNDNLKEFDCMCIVQHHTKDKFRINEIYAKSSIPLIYDCQSKLLANNKSNTKLIQFGN